MKNLKNLSNQELNQEMERCDRRLLNFEMKSFNGNITKEEEERWKIDSKYEKELLEERRQRNTK